MQTIFLDQDDDIISVCDRLDWTAASRVLFVLPQRTAVFKNGLDLARLRRYADRQRVEVGLVTGEKTLLRQARSLGLPAFATLEEAESSRRGWWRRRRRREWVGLPAVGGLQGDRPSARQDGRSVGDSSVADILRLPQLSWRQWVIRYAAILLFFIALALFFIGFAFTLPRATITLHPETQPVTASLPVLADPTLADVSLRDMAVPARRLTVTQSWKTQIDATGVIVLPHTPATGQVVFTNLTEEPVDIPAGLILRAGDLAFETIAAADLVGVVDSTTAVGVVALEPGPDGNVPADAITQIEDAELAELVEARNPAALTGGAVRQIPAVAAADMERLRAQARQFLQAVALAEMETQLLQPEFLARESLRVTAVQEETFSHAVGEETAVLSLQMRAELQATAVNPSLAGVLAAQPLAAAVPAGFQLLPGSIQLAAGEALAADDAGRVTVTILAEGMAAADLNLTDPTAVIAGQPVETAMAYLYQQLPLAAIPQIEIWPLWFQRLPYRSGRIQVITAN